MKKCICILLALILALCASAASAESAGEGTGPESRDYEHATVGNPTKLDGCFFTGMWGNITSDVDIRDLVAGYNLVKWDGGFSQYRFDHSVVSGAVAGTDRDGNRRYEIVLCDDLYFSDGTPVTARDYAFSILLQCSPLISDLGGHPEKHDYLLGYEEYSTGKSGKLAGVRVISDRQLTLIVRKESLPYFFELARFRFCPYPAGVIAPGCRVYDSEDGAYIGNETDPDGEPLFTADLLRKTILDPETGYLVHPDPGTGPYRIESFDGTTAELSVNTWYKGNEDGEKPRIDRLTYTHARYDTMMQGLASGEYTLLNKIMPAEAVRSGIELCLSDDRYAREGYYRTGLTSFYFMPGSGVAQSAAVRRAIAHCVDKQQLTHSYVGIFGKEAHGLYGMGQWMYQILSGAIAFPVEEPGPDNDMTDAEYDKQMREWEELSLEDIPVYEYDPDEADRLLNEAGWNLNIEGDPFRRGEDTIRCKRFGDELVPLQLNMAYPIGTPAEAALFHLADAAAEEGYVLSLTAIPMEDLLKQYHNVLPREFDLMFLALNFDIMFDPSSDFVEREGEEPMWTETQFADQELYDLTVDMRKTEPGALLEYCQKWLKYQQRLAETMPLLPLYSNVYFDFYARVLRDYFVAANVTWTQAIVPAYLDNTVEVTEEEPEDEFGIEEFGDEGLVEFE